MFWYTADIGSWERGIVVKFKAKNDKAALKRAGKIADKKGEHNNVVRIRQCGRIQPASKRMVLNGGRIIWDEYNGGLLWYGSKPAHPSRHS